LFPGWRFDLMACLLHGPKNNVTWIETTVQQVRAPDVEAIAPHWWVETLLMSLHNNTLQPQQLSSSFPILFGAKQCTVHQVCFRSDIF
jgi:hypothetical protein